MKSCARCKEAKPHAEFVANRKAKDGLQSWCRACARASHRRWYAKNREREQARGERYRAENPELFRGYAKRRWAENTDAERERWKRWASENRDARREAQQRHRQEHADELREKQRRYRRQNPEKHQQDEARRRARKLAAFVEDVDSLELVDRYDGRCGICLEPLDAEFHVDHIIPLTRGGEHSYANTQPAHVRCNCQKGNRHPRRDGQVRPDPITASGGATASDESVATPEVEAASKRIASEEEAA